MAAFKQADYGIDDPKLEGALRMLPSCTRCRRKRKQCDLNLPSCHSCTRAKESCVFLDHTTGELVPRRYVQSLVNRYASLRKMDMANTLPVDASVAKSNHQPSPDLELFNPIEHRVEEFAPTGLFDAHHYPLASNRDLRYLGSSSSLAFAAHVINKAAVAGINFVDDSKHTTSDTVPVLDRTDFYRHLIPPKIGFQYLRDRNTINYFIQTYLSSVHLLFPIFDTGSLLADVDAATSNVATEDQRLRVGIMCAIACETLASHDKRLLYCSDLMYLGVADHIKVVTSSPSESTLQSIMLLILYAFFNTKRGNFWHLLGMACRLCVDLGYHNQALTPESLDPLALDRRRRLFWSLYSLERHIGLTLGRPTDLPMSELHVSLPSEFDLELSSQANDVSMQPILSKVALNILFRVHQLESAIYQNLYLIDDKTTSIDAQWVTSIHLELLQLHQSVPIVSPFLQSNIDLVFHYCVILLFRPVYIARSEDVSFDYVAEYQASAVALLRIYDELYRHRDPFAITVPGAHAIFVAGLALVDPYISNGYIHIASSQRPIFLEASAICCNLLCFCAERWTGLRGMRESYTFIVRGIIERMYSA